jgi:hypothetical protein
VSGLGVGPVEVDQVYLFGLGKGLDLEFGLFCNFGSVWFVYFHKDPFCNFLKIRDLMCKFPKVYSKD